MMGTGGALTHSVLEVDYGLIPRTCKSLFQRVFDAKAANPSDTFHIEISYMEVGFAYWICVKITIK
jgi:hypothetical protein